MRVFFLHISGSRISLSLVLVLLFLNLLYVLFFLSPHHVVRASLQILQVFDQEDTFALAARLGLHDVQDRSILSCLLLRDLA